MASSMWYSGVVHTSRLLGAAAIASLSAGVLVGPGVLSWSSRPDLREGVDGAGGGMLGIGKVKWVSLGQFSIVSGISFVILRLLPRPCRTQGSSGENGSPRPVCGRPQDRCGSADI